MRLAWSGYRLGFEPAAVALHVHRREDAELARQVGNYGVGYAATMLALVLDDPRHLGAIIATAPRATAALSRAYWARLRTPAPEPAGPSAAATHEAGIADLARLELLGMARGPAAYLHSALCVRRWRRTHIRGPVQPGHGSR